uniref:Uncharacterized protein n=1 Tax=Corvus moneduloides TaxID=1196302 RepID=A0A8C3DLW7_CORMO
MSCGGTLSILRSDSYAELSQYRDQHFRVSSGRGRAPRCCTAWGFKGMITLPNFLVLNEHRTISEIAT